MNKPSKWAAEASKWPNTGDLTPRLSLFLPFCSFFSPWYKLLQIKISFDWKFLIRNAVLTHPWTYFWPGAIHEIFLCEANGLENHTRDVNILPRGKVFKTFISGKYCIEDLQANQQREHKVIQEMISYSIFFLNFWSWICIWAYWGYFGSNCNAAALFPAADPGAMWVSNSPIFIRSPNFPISSARLVTITSHSFI